MATVKKITFVNVNGFSVPVATMVTIPDAIDFGAATTNKMTRAEALAMGRRTMTPRKARALAEGRAKLAKDREDARIGRASMVAAEQALATGKDVAITVGNVVVKAELCHGGDAVRISAR